MAQLAMINLLQTEIVKCPRLEKTEENYVRRTCHFLTQVSKKALPNEKKFC